MKRAMLAICLLGLGFAVYGQATIGSLKSASGKVELQSPGGAWVAAKPGDGIVKGTMVSVGFKSSAVIVTADATITVKALTRLTIEDIVKTQGGTKTDLYLSAGRIKTEVKPETGLKSDFRVKAPTATASVRGTGFDFDGINLAVRHGLVILASRKGRSRSVGAGYAAFVTSGNDVPIPVLGTTGTVIAMAAALDQANSGSGDLDTSLTAPPQAPLEEDAPVTLTIE